MREGRGGAVVRRRPNSLFVGNRRFARQRWELSLSPQLLERLKYFSEEFAFSISSGDLLLLDKSWYVTHAGLLRLAHRHHCCGIRLQPANGNYGGPKVRDRLCQIIRQHQLDPNLVKSYAVDFCGTKTLREATREQVENFVAHLADWAEKDRNALLCQLNSYFPAKEGAA